MADIFLSYKREDLAYAQAIAKAVTDEGYTVFFDVHDDVGIRAGESWDERLELELASTKAVIVLWSHRSVKSNNVRDEARRAAARGILVPVMLDDCEAPLGLGMMQAASLQDWSGERDDPQWRFLIDRGVKSIVSGQIQKEIPTSAPRSEGASDSAQALLWPKIGIVAASLLAVVFVVFAGVRMFGSWQLPCDAADPSCHTGQSAPIAAAAPASNIDALVSTFVLSDDNDAELVLLRTNIERSLVELLWRNNLRVDHALTPETANQARFQFEGNIVRMGDEVSLYLVMREDGQIGKSAEVTASLSEFNAAHRSLPAALLYFMNRNSETFEPLIMTQRPTNSALAWWMFEEAKRLAASGRVEPSAAFLDKARQVDEQFISALWTKGDLLRAHGDPLGEALVQEALAANPDLQRHSIHTAPIDPMPALKLAALSAPWSEMEEGLSLRQFEAEEYAVTVTAWTVDPTKFVISAKPAQDSSGETVAQIRTREEGLLAINGGFWDQDRLGRITPSGLFITDEVVLKSYVEGAGSGLFLVTEAGAQIQYGKTELPEAVRAGVQAGPIVIEPTGEIGIRTKNAIRAARTAVCTTSQGLVTFVIIEGGLSLYELATMLGDPDHAFGFDCSTALNLSGGPTSQASFEYTGSSIEVEALWKTQSALVVSRP